VSGGRFPCGCVWDEVGDAFVFQPCSLDCPEWAEIRDRIDRWGKPLRVVMDPGLPGLPTVLRCPGCGKVQDSATGILGGNAVPEAGDVGVCFDCAAVFEYTGRGPGCWAGWSWWG
jgi:hypothetical protein